MPAPKVGLAGQVVTYAGSNQNVRAAQITVVNSATSVNARRVGAAADEASLAYVDIGETPPAAPTPYFQAIDTVA